jgi:ABC-type transporter lipoprotein component MlaA
MKEAINELERILAQLEAKQGTVQSLDDYRMVKQLYEQAHHCIAVLRSQLNVDTEETTRES